MTGTWSLASAYDGDEPRRQTRCLRTRRVRPDPTRRKRYGRDRHKRCNAVGRFFCRTRRCRRAATRYEKKAGNSAGFVRRAAFVTAER